LPATTFARNDMLSWNEIMRRMLRILTLIAFASMMVFGVSPTTAAPVAPGAPAQTSGDYQLGVADELRVTVFNEPNLSGKFTVNSNGMLSLPLIGEVRAAGTTVDQLRTAITDRLADGYLLHPRVSLEVLSFRPFYILGEVNKPGKYPYSTGLTVLNAVATAEGFTYRANKGKVFIKHPGTTEETEVRLTPATPVRPGDTIRIGERYF
jgi:polysaccharide export outer membrane protein